MVVKYVLPHLPQPLKLCLSQEMIETYLRPLRAHDWDRGALLSFRAMKRPDALPYEAVQQPVLVVIGSQDSMLLKSTKRVGHSRSVG